MYRFPNPQSNPEWLIKCFRYLYDNHERDKLFNFHHMQELLVPATFVSSSGMVGIEALIRGSNTDLTRDRSYNQCKSMAELYRSLGWISAVGSRSTFTFTLMGDHLVQAMPNHIPFFEKCLLGIVTENEILDSKGDQNLRPFATILKMMRELDGTLSKNEMIFGPLSLEDDTSQESLNQLVAKLKDFRKNPEDFHKEFEALLGRIKITLVTAQNYTRFPIGMLTALNWVRRVRKSDAFAEKQVAFVLSEHGQEILDCEVDNRKDIRLNDLNSLDEEAQETVSYFAFYKLLEQSGFNTSTIDLASLGEQVCELLGTKDLLFSPYQTLPVSRLKDVFDEQVPTVLKKNSYFPEDPEFRSKLERLNPNNIAYAPTVSLTSQSNFRERVLRLASGRTRDAIVKLVKLEELGSRKEKFYPLVQDIFRSCSLDCRLPQHGVHSQRWDAIILSDSDSIPIEIKSPTEERYLSIKAVRQALENKVVLQSRNAVPNHWGTATFVVGYELPNSRAEVDALIDDIWNTFQVRIAVMGIDMILKLGVDCILDEKSVHFTELTARIGVMS